MTIRVLLGPLLVLALVDCGGPPSRLPTPTERDTPPPAEALVPVRRLDRGEATGGERVLVRHAAAGAPYRLPHQPVWLLSDYYDCRGRRRHRGVDLASAAPEAGLGRPIVAIGRSVVLEWGTPESDPQRYGRPLTNGDRVARDGEDLPTWVELPAYGRVHFFTASRGTAHTGAVVTTELLEGPLAGHRVRYMHLGAVSPDVQVGSVLEAGQEIGLMGGTAVQSSTPHLHVDIEDAEGHRVDPAPYLGLPPHEGEVPEC